MANSACDTNARDRSRSRDSVRREASIAAADDVTNDSEHGRRRELSCREDSGEDKCNSTKQQPIKVIRMSGALLVELDTYVRQWRVADVKSRLVQVSATPARYIRLLHGGRELEHDLRTLAEELVPPGASLSFVRSPPEIVSLLWIPEDDPLLVPFLIDSMADPDEKDDAGWTALHWAASAGHVSVGKALLDHSDYTLVDDCGAGKTTAFHICAENGHVALCTVLADQSELTTLNARSSNGNTALHLAARCGHIQVCNVLLNLENFKALNHQNFLGWTALHYAAAVGLWPVCEALCSHAFFGAAGDVTNNGETALHWAALNGHAAICALLVKHIDIHAQDVEGCNAMDGARLNGHIKVCELLKLHEQVAKICKEDPSQ